MHEHKMSETEIAIRIVPKRVRWPEPSAGNIWAAAHRCVDAWHDLVRKIDADCAEVEEDPQLSANGIARRRAEICDQALRKLVNSRPFDSAETTLTSEIDALDRLTAPNAQQSQMHQNMTKALADLREGIEATRRLILDRCRVRESAPA